MMADLRRRLTLLMTALTALVLAGALAVTWQYSAAQYEASAEAMLAQNFSSLCDRLNSSDTISDSWLAEQEHQNRLLIFLQDNGAALHFAGASLDNTARIELEPLLTEGLAQLLDTEKHDSSGAVLRQNVTFALNAYRCHAALLPRGTKGSYLLAVMAQDMSFVHQYRLQTVVQYTALWIVGTLLLACISYLLTGKALAPTALAMRWQKEFIAAASHELRSPLAVVKASLDAAQHTTRAEEQGQFLYNAEAETDRMARLVDDLLVLANGDLDNLPAHLQAVEPDNLCIEVYEQFYLLAKQQAHTFALHLPEEAVPPIQADAERLRQLLSILLRNALEHTPTGTPIELVLTHDTKAEAVMLTVQDHGPGIPDAEKNRIFERFYSADPSRTAKQNFGLGLSVAKELARLHRAELTVTDTLGGGACFTVRFAAAA